MLRFVLLRHQTPPGSARSSHWDLMFEEQGVLRTWAVEELPTPGETITAEQLADHRLAYLEYEGPISDNRGDVRREDAGTYKVMIDLPDHFAAIVKGQRLQGRLDLRCVASAQWELKLESP